MRIAIVLASFSGLKFDVTHLTEFALIENEPSVA